MSKTIKAGLILGFIALALTFYRFQYLPSKQISSFNIAYQAYDEAEKNYLVPGIAATINENIKVQQWQEALQSISDNYSNDSPAQRLINVGNAKQGLASLNDISDMITEGDNNRTNVDESLLTLNQRAASISISKFQKMAFEVTDLAQKEVENTRLLRDYLRNETQNRESIFQAVIDDKGFVGTYSRFEGSLKDGSKSIKTLVDKHEGTYKEVINLKESRKATYQRFIGSTNKSILVLGF
jgi:hypothetical protein